ncbi:MAG: type II secretion system F family protein [Hydrogenophilaceae bacterium]
MTELYLTIALAILSLVAASVFSWRAGSETQRSRKNLDRLQAALDHSELQAGRTAPAARISKPPPIIETWQQRAGYVPSMRLYGLFALPAPILAIAGGLVFGIKGIVIGLFLLYPLGLAVFLHWRIERFRDQVVAQLPGFVDALARILSIGVSIELAFRNASEECEEPLRGITAQILVRTQAGLTIEDAMGLVAETYDIKELSFLASVFYLGVRYGGNARAVLERIALAMRERERGQKELHAMTSETRASAWILSALPIVVGLMTMYRNPGYLLGMWNDPFGRQLLFAAVALQVIGMLLLFRMAKLRNL